MFKNFCLVLMLFSALPFSSCRKGKDDPLISFRSRAARVAGDWNIQNYNENQSTLYAYPNGNSLTQTFNRNFGTVNYSETISDTGNTLRILNGKISKSEFHFTKSGNWNSVIEYYLYIPQSVGGYYISKTRFEEEGTWKFNSKTGGLKNKESMNVLTTNSNQFFYTYTTYLGTVVDSIADSTSITLEKAATWKLIGLSNTKLKAEISAESSYISLISGISGTKITSTSSTEIEMNQ